MPCMHSAGVRDMGQMGYGSIGHRSVDLSDFFSAQ